MADIWNAYQHLNESLGLKLDKETLMRAEATFKEKFLAEKGFPREHIKDPSEWEFFAYVVPATDRMKKG